jgi:metal-responsive CopG/Arc/MetJ family transcriptional regulator
LKPIPDPIFSSAEKLARRLGMSRSQLYARAVREFIQQHDDDIITKRLNDLYKDEPSGLDPTLQSIQARSVDSGSWK